MKIRLVRWAYSGLTAGLTAGSVLAVHWFIESGQSYVLNTASLGAILGYLSGIAAGLIFGEFQIESAGLNLGREYD
ncbi:MAG: hypothetical protein U5K99_07560 [Anaerolineales bacterium]|nr:hypothetical protein [Anaerolineales bacterium]